MSDLSLEDSNNTAEAQTGLHATTPENGDFAGECILQVGPNLSGNRTPHHFVDGIQGISSEWGGRGVVGHAMTDFPAVSGGADRIGVLGTANKAGVFGLVGFQNGFTRIPGPPVTVAFPGDPPGWNANGSGPADTSIFPLPSVVSSSGVVSSAGVVGMAQDSNAATPSHAGVLGINLGIGDGVVGQSASGNGVVGNATAGNGVSGSSTGNHAVFGNNIPASPGKPATLVRTSGCYGVTLQNRGVSGVVGSENWAQNNPKTIDSFATGVFGQAGLFFGPGPRESTVLKAQGFAGVFLGPVAIWGPLIVNGGSAKSAAVPHPDGSHRLLYCMESPESWFEDFGEAKLVNGKAIVTLDVDFAAVAKMESYHVFVSPYGECNGLYVTRKNRKGFEVREQGGGRNNLTFSYRIVARRKDVAAERLAKYEPASEMAKWIAKQKPGKPEAQKKKR